jgi:hypothetical protein
MRWPRTCGSQRLGDSEMRHSHVNDSYRRIYTDGPHSPAAQSLPPIDAMRCRIWAAVKPAALRIEISLHRPGASRTHQGLYRPASMRSIRSRASAARCASAEVAGVTGVGRRPQQLRGRKRPLRANRQAFGRIARLRGHSPTSVRVALRSSGSAPVHARRR